MNRIVLNDDLANQLLASGEQVALYDSSEKLLGYFRPSGETPMTPEMLQWAKEQISDEELDRRMQNKRGISTEELLKRLNAL